MGLSFVVVLLLVGSCVGKRHAIRSANNLPKTPSFLDTGALDQFEQLLVNVPDPERLRQALFSLTRYPHVFGVNNIVPQVTAAMAASLAPIPNATVKVESFTALSTLPLQRKVMLKANASAAPVSLDLNEACVPQDPTSCLPDITPLWGGYSPGTPNDQPTPYVPVVYGNYCREEDYEYLERVGVNVSGTIVLCRYGQIFRAQKVQFAEPRGVVGVLVYSDPADDGFTQGEEFPNGPARSSSGGQRGSYCYGQLCPGDPDPARTKERGCGDAYVLPKLPVQPISWGAALPILQALGGEPVVTADGWQGGLPLHYHFGPGPATASMHLTVNSSRREGYNIISEIEGGDLKHEIVALGCHMDAWVIGAVDPLTGQAIMIELARLMGEMYAAGWRPLRTIQFLAWDGEEYNLLGSTDYTDRKGKMIMERMVAYVNIDAIISQWYPDSLTLGVSASPVLADILRDALAKTPSPVNRSLSMSTLFDGSFEVLGDGSDYCSFINRLGVASLDIEWASPGVASPQYHSRYDSFFLVNNITDPQFAVHSTSTTMIGLVMYHLATDASLHFSPSFAASQYAAYKASLLAQFPVLAQLKWAAFDAALSQFTDSATAAQLLVNASDPLANSLLANLDRQFLYEPGLPGRIYFRHLMQAPDLLNDYNSQVFPGVAYYAPAGDLVNAQLQLDLISAALGKASDSISKSIPTNNIVKIAVIVVGVCFVLAVVAITIVYIRRRTANKRRYTELPSQ